MRSVVRFVPISILAGVGVVSSMAEARLAAEPASHGAATIAEPQQAPPDHRFGLARPLPRTPGTIRIAAWNILNFFDNRDDPTLSGEFDDIQFATTPERMEAIAKGIRDIDADILALEEVESYDAVVWFRDNYLKGMGYDHVASKDVGYYRGVECSLLSRIPITNVRVWPNESLDGDRREGIGWSPIPSSARVLTYQRSPLMVDLRTKDGYELTVFVVHHKAGSDYDHHREAEALRTVEKIRAIEKANPSRNITVLGDFNAAPWDKSFRVYLQGGMIDTLAHRLIERDNPESDLYKTHESQRVLDYVLFNSALHRELVIGSPHVYSPFTPPPSYDWQTDPHPAGYASDHYPVIVDILPRDIP